jgi:hypothetical protein
MNRDVYYIDRAMPIPMLLAYHNAILVANQRCSGKTLRTHHVRVMDVCHQAYDCTYDGAIVFHDDRAEGIFRDVCREQNLDVHAELLWERTPYVSERVHLELRGDARMAVWHHRRDAFVHLSGDEVCDRPWDVRGNIRAKVMITDVIIAGAHNHVRKALRRYARYRDLVKHADRYNRHDQTGMTTGDWEDIVTGMYEADMYLITSEGLVIKVTHGCMTWVRPSGAIPEYKYPQLAVAGWVRERIDANLKQYSRRHHSPSPSPFVDSMVGVVATSKVELGRN